MADFFLEPNPDWHDEWQQNLAARKEADRLARARLLARYPEGFHWGQGHKELALILADHPRGDAVQRLARWVRNFFEAGVSSETSAGIEFEEMVSAWIAKKTTPLRAKVLPDITKDHAPKTVVWEGSVFCFTGALNWGTRQMAEGIVVSRGGRCIERPTDKLDYLVHGGAPGGKMKTALAHRAKGIPVVFLLGDTLPDYF